MRAKEIMTANVVTVDPYAGVHDTAEEKRAILLAAENSPGVREVRDRVFVPTQAVRSLSWGL